MHSFLRAQAVLLLLTGCGPATESASETAPTSTSEADTSTGATPTTGAPEFCGCADPQVVDGNLDVDGLAGLAGACIGEVTGRLRIEGITDPTVLQPLAGLRRVDALRIAGNPGLVDLSALACLEEVRDRLDIDNNPALVDVSALARVRVARFVEFEKSPITALPSFAPDYQGARTLLLRDLPEIVDLDSLAGWPSVIATDGAMGVEIVRVPKLQSVAGLAGPLGSPVTPDALMDIQLAELPALTSLTGLEAFRDGDLTLAHLPQITSLVPLAAVEQVGTLQLLGMPGLSSLHGLHNLKVARDLQLGGCDDGDGLSGIVDLAGLDALAQVEWLFSVVANPGLVALTGAPLLSKVRDLDLVDNPQLSAGAVAAFEKQIELSHLCFAGRVECGCLRKIPEAVDGCPAQWSGGSAVTASGEGGSLDGATAFFGWTGPGPYNPYLTLVVADVVADLEAVKNDGLWQPTDAGTPKLMVETSIDYQDWIGVNPADARLVQPGRQETEFKVQVTVSGRLGDWTMLDPADPPRLVGELATTDPNAATSVLGPFDAVFCNDFIWILTD